MRLRWVGWILRLYLVVMLLFIFAPAISLILFSFHEGRVQSFPIQNYSTKWYLDAWENRDIREGLINSLRVGIVVSAISTTLGFLSAFVLCRRPPRRELLYIAFVTLPSMVPLLLSGLALLMYFQHIRLSGTLWAVVLAHVCYTSPFAMALIYNSYDRLNIELEQAARNLGATHLGIIFKVVIPQLWSALVGAALLSFLISWDEFVMAWFVGGFEKTLPVVIYGMMGGSFSPSLNAVGTLAMVVSAILLLVVFGIQTYAYRNQRKY